MRQILKAVYNFKRRKGFKGRRSETEYRGKVGHPEQACDPNYRAGRGLEESLWRMKFSSLRKLQSELKVYRVNDGDPVSKYKVKRAKNS